jgi:hypothetical protein
VETENYHHPFANFIPNILRFTDLPAIAAALAPRKVTIAGEEARPAYSGSHIEVRAQAAWDAAALSQF